ncbi:hypothetical protein ONS95_004768 [Cadophora gregata]|uniref:uncharacterized protein n=1 Tax=Cadophora gregata TaxID=51156 RepID=UPI0026DCF667|nr:uncharacterized protein ONS95_004768 [Cadophora gregata]KAK0104479.1 hypothetical protein ONS95_004768 [Cadophora gregata]KAK0115429.1 hypothetical protein ONS96_013885 [Cadophora gregata f. sp. sojae]
MSGISSSTTTNQAMQRNPAITHDCPQCPSPHVNPRGSRVLRLLAQLPSELHSIVVQGMIVPQRPCLDHIFGSCLDSWGCPNGSHMDLRDLREAIVPCPRLTSLSTFFYDEGHKLFFEHHSYQFPVRATRSDLQKVDIIGQEHRDFLATRLLNFVDRPDCVGLGSKTFKIHGKNRLFGDVDSYRHLIQHLVFTASLVDDSMKYRPDWDWPLKVDWQRLPRLKTLVLDLRYYSFSPRYLGGVLTQEDYDSRIATGVKGMQILKLKRLVIYGVCSGAFHNDQYHQRRMRSLFETALDIRGTLEFRDSASIANW